MKKRTITVKEDLWLRLNRAKYEFELETIDQVIRRLFEIAKDINLADTLFAKSNGAANSSGCSSNQLIKRGDKNGVRDGDK